MPPAPLRLRPAAALLRLCLPARPVRRGGRCAACLLLLLATGWLSGCGTSRETTAPPGPVKDVVEAEGARLRVPEGWLDFSRDSVGILWLVRRDFQASLSLEELHGAGEAGGAAAAARLLLRLETAGSAVRLVAPPAGDPESGAGTVSYQLVRESGEQVRVTLAERGGKIFAVTAVQQAGATAPFAELVRIQRGLVSDLLR